MTSHGRRTLETSAATYYIHTVQYSLIKEVTGIEADRKTGGSPVEKALSPRALAKRDQILTGAEQIFTRQGFAATSTDAVAAEAGVSKRTLYVHYPNKEELFAAVLRRLTIEKPRTRVLESFELASPESTEELRRTLTEPTGKIVGTMMQPDYLALLRTVIAETHRFPHLGTLFRSTVPESTVRVASDLIRRARERELVGEEVGEEEATRMFFGPLVTYVLMDGLLVTEGLTRPPTPENIRGIVDLYMKAIA